MPYLEDIRAAYEQVRAGSSERALVLLALQYENWQNLPRDCQEKIEEHQEYAKLDSAADRPADAAKALVLKCNRAPSSRLKRSSLGKVFRLARIEPNRSDAGIATDAVSWFISNRDKLQPKPVVGIETADNCLWCSEEQLLIETPDPAKAMSDVELSDCIQQLGLAHYHSTEARSRIFYFSCQPRVVVVNTNCLDQGMSAYFYQPPEQQESKTRDLRNSALGVSECLVLDPVSSTQIELIRCKELESAISIDLGNFISAHAERIQAL